MENSPHHHVVTQVAANISIVTRRRDREHNLLTLTWFCHSSVSQNGLMLRDILLFAPDEITAKAGSQLKVVMDNVAIIPVMFHNVVFLNVGPRPPR